MYNLCICYCSCTFTIAAIFDRKWHAVYTIAIYDRVTSEVDIPKMQMPAIFSLDLKVIFIRIDELASMIVFFVHGPNVNIIQYGLNLIKKISWKITHISDKLISNVKSRIYSLPMHLHKHQLYLLEQHSE